MNYYEALYTSKKIGMALDESLEEHDKKYHKGHYDPKTQQCGKRDILAKGDVSDTLVKTKSKAECAQMVNNLLDKFKYNSRFGGLVKYEASGFWDDNELQIAGTYENGTVGAANAPMSFDLAKKIFGEITKLFPAESWSIDKDKTLRIRGKFSPNDVISNIPNKD